MNRSTLEIQVKDYLNRPGVTATSLDAWITSVEAELNRALAEHPRMIDQVSITQASGDPVMPLPADTLKALTVVCGARLYQPYPITLREEAKRSKGGFISQGAYLELFPTPAVETEMVLTYSRALDPLINAEDENWVSSYFSDVYLYGCLKEAAIYLKDMTSLQAWGAEFTGRLNDLAGQGWGQNRMAGPGRIR